MIEPLYTPKNTTPAYQLNWGVTLFWRNDPIPEANWLAPLQEATETDGVRVIKHHITPGNASQFFVSTKPHVSPSQLLRTVKGRLQHVIREQVSKAFQRNYCVRSVGAARRDVVEDYVAAQLQHHRMADPGVQERLAGFQRCNPGIDLSKPSFSSHGQYWYNLHVVIVNAERWMEVREDVLNRLSRMIDSSALKRGDRLSRVAMFADHVHLTMGCAIGRSPEEVALSYLNNCAYACGLKPVFQFGYYVGTIGEYDRGAV